MVQLGTEGQLSDQQPRRDAGGRFPQDEEQAALLTTAQCPSGGRAGRAAALRSARAALREARERRRAARRRGRGGRPLWRQRSKRPPRAALAQPLSAEAHCARAHLLLASRLPVAEARARRATPTGQPYARLGRKPP